MKKFLLSFINCFFFVLAFADVKLPALVSKGMVLQRNKPIHIWGWADAGEQITLTFKGKTYQTEGQADGKFSLTLPAMEAGGPYQMQLKAKNSITIDDILIGDVWVCSGQSNMEFEMFKAQKLYAKEIAAANYPQIRQFEVVKKFSFTTALQDVTATEGWQVANPQNVLNFTAAGYFFALELHQKYKVPIGLINATWGGTPAEAWLSEDGLQNFPNFTATVNQFKSAPYLQEVKNKDQQAIAQWFKNIKEQDKGHLANGLNWASAQTNTQDWPTTKLPAFWTEEIFKNVNAGVVWYQKDIEIPAALSGKKALLYLGNIYNQDSTWINGILVGHTEDKHKARVYQLNDYILKPGINTITVRVLAWASPPGFVKDKPYKIEIEGETIDLTGTWKYQLGIAAQPLPPTTNLAYQPAVLYKGMIAPLTPYPIKGVIWYQGEANSARGKEYQQLFPALITDWRKQWNLGDFPFLYVQLPNYLAVKPQPSQSNWAELREAQLFTLSLPKTGMAVTYDIGEWNDIHPQNKKDVGLRLALAAQKIAYQEKVVHSGPIYQKMKKKENKLILYFTSTGSGLISKDGKALKYFAISADAQNFVWANAIIKNNKVEVSHPDIKNPVAVRYAWADNPEGANLYNKEGLPASPFRTDKPLN
ncbi:sialate O-acetylesterase [Pedobacter puniceum]|uniref:Sialate O-acetylesterase n=1 Tax=Pedobacter puniceum TaxID=2666136 RepID=A0A7K0FSS5_9SPHI|nr:sialate O-acetylesterase [Pedobacter puniceum]MRX48515.1 sialate O-acetylesterase [Pedobacter puniceum]